MGLKINILINRFLPHYLVFQVSNSRSKETKKLFATRSRNYSGVVCKKNPKNTQIKHAKYNDDKTFFFQPNQNIPYFFQIMGVLLTTD